MFWCLLNNPTGSVIIIFRDRTVELDIIRIEMIRNVGELINTFPRRIKYKMNKIGTRTEPWGTPQVLSSTAEFENMKFFC